MVYQYFQKNIFLINYKIIRIICINIGVQNYQNVVFKFSKVKKLCNVVKYLSCIKSRRFNQKKRRGTWRIDREKRQIFVRRYWYLSSISEIAKDFAISEGNIKIILFRTRNKLKKVLEKEGIIL